MQEGRGGVIAGGQPELERAQIMVVKAQAIENLAVGCPPPHFLYIPYEPGSEILYSMTNNTRTCKNMDSKVRDTSNSTESKKTLYKALRAMNVKTMRV